MSGADDFDTEGEDLEAAAVNGVGSDALPELAPGPREGQREAVQARALLEKAERMLEKVQPDDRAEVEKLITGVRTALTDRKWDNLTKASNALADTLFYLEDA